VTLTGVTPIHNIGVVGIKTTGGITTVTLPKASEFKNCSFRFRNTVDAQLYIKPDATDTIEGYSLLGGEGVSSYYKGSFIKLTARGTTSWVVSDIIGTWGVASLKPERYTSSYSSAIPTTGTWAKGDIIYNDLTTSTVYAGWICTVAGTPGTWKGFGLIEA
jgi:hypothetical protein